MVSPNDSKRTTDQESKSTVNCPLKHWIVHVNRQLTHQQFTVPAPALITIHGAGPWKMQKNRKLLKHKVGKLSRSFLSYHKNIENPTIIFSFSKKTIEQSVFHVKKKKRERFFSICTKNTLSALMPVLEYDSGNRETKSLFVSSLGRESTVSTSSTLFSAYDKWDDKEAFQKGNCLLSPFTRNMPSAGSRSSTLKSRPN